MERLGKKRQLRVLAGLLAVFVALYFMTDLFGGIRADDENVTTIGETAEEDGIMLLAAYTDSDITEADSPFVIESCTVKIGGKEIRPGEVAEVSDGASFELRFSWHLKDQYDTGGQAIPGFYAGSSFVYPDFKDNLGGISFTLPEQQIKDSNSQVVGTYKMDADGALRVEINNTQNVSKYEGALLVSGNLSLNDANLDKDGQFKISFANNGSWTLRDNGYNPNVGISKSAAGEVYAENGKYYQDFTVTVDNWSKKEATGVTIVDEHGVFFKERAMTVKSLTIGGAAQTVPGVAMNGNRDTIVIGTIPANQKAVLTYRIEVDSSKFVGGQSSNWNKATVKTNEGQSKEAWGSAKFQFPGISKSGTVTGDSIVWTITVTPGFFADAIRNGNFTLRDIPGANISVQSGPTNLTANLDGTYTATVTTSKPAADTYKKTEAKNRAELTVGGEKLSADASVWINPSSAVDAVAKTHGASQYASDGTVTVPWQVTVHIPNVEGLTALEIGDAVDDAHRFEAKDAEIDYSTFRLSAGGNTYTLVRDADRHNGKFALNGVQNEKITYNSWYRENVNYTVTITDEAFLNANKGSDIVISYDMKVYSGWIAKITNRATVDVRQNHEPLLRDEAEDTVSRPITVSKERVWWSNEFNQSGVHYPHLWKITVSSGQVQDGQNVTVTDTLPEDFELNQNGGAYALKVSSNGTIYTSGTDYTLSVTDTGFTVTAAAGGTIHSALKNGNTVEIFYLAGMKNDKFNQYEAETDERTLTLKNTAVVEHGTQHSTAETVDTLHIRKPGQILVKSVSDKLASPDKAEAEYTLEINKDGGEINGGKDLTVTDVLGTKLKFIDGSVTVSAYNSSTDLTEKAGVKKEWKASASGKNQTLIFTLSDSAYYRITYKAETTERLSLTDLSDPAYSDAMEQEIANRYGNDVSFSVSGSDPFAAKAMLSEGAYRSNASMSYQLAISGTKKWENVSGTPDQIDLELIQKETYIDPLVGKPAFPGKTKETKYICHLVKNLSDKKPNTADERWYVVNIGSDGSWKFTLDGLVSRDIRGTEYSYKLREITDDGKYAPTYSFTESGTKINMGSSSNYEINKPIDVEITNSPAKELQRTGEFRLKKVSSVGSAALAGAEFKLDSADVTDWTGVTAGGQPLAKGGTFAVPADGVTVDGLPSGNYTLTETKTPGGYVKDPSVFAFYVKPRGTIEATSAGNYIFYESDAAITVSNAPTELGIRKFEIGGSEQLAGAVLVITGNADLSRVAVTGGTAEKKENGRLEFTTTERTAVITGLPAGDYVLKETAAPDGYEVTTEFYFTMNADGTVSPTAGKDNGAVNGLSDNTITLRDESKVGKITLKKQDESGDPLSGAEFSLSPAAPGIRLNGADSVVMAADSVRFATKGEDIEIDRLPIGEYVLTEVSAPGGYFRTGELRFEIALNGDGTVAAKSADARLSGGTAVLTDERVVPGTLQIEKTGDGGKHLAGVQFTIVTENGNLSAVTATDADISVRETKKLIFTTMDSGITKIAGLSAGDYTLTESASPSGYLKDGSSFAFAVDNAGAVSQTAAGGYTFGGATVSLANRITELRISKTDMAGGEQLPGATLTITPDEGEGGKDLSNVKVEKAGNVSVDDGADRIVFVTGSETALVKGLPAGKYVLEETAAPDGYAVTTRFWFTVNEDGSVTKTDGRDNGSNTLTDQTITLKDEPIVVKIDKTDLGGKHLSGAGIEIKNMDGKPLGAVKVTDVSGKAQQSLTSDTITFVTGEKVAVLTGLPAGNYTLTETAAPNGYEQITTGFSFTVGEDGKIAESTLTAPSDSFRLNGNTITVVNEPGKTDPDDPNRPGDDKPSTTPGGHNPNRPAGSGSSRPSDTTGPDRPESGTTSERPSATEPDEVEPEKTTSGTAKEPGKTTAPSDDPDETTRKTAQTEDEPESGNDSGHTKKDENPHTGVPLVSLAAVFAAAGTAVFTMRKRRNK